MTQKVPVQTLMLVQQGLWTTAFLAQSHVADLTSLHYEPLFHIEWDTQREKLDRVAETICKPFRDISTEDVIVALEHCSVASEGIQAEDYSNFLAKLSAHGEAGREMAAAFEELKAKPRP